MATIFIRDDLANEYAIQSGHTHYIDMPNGEGYTVREYFQSFYEANQCRILHEEDNSWVKIKTLLIL